MGNATRLIHINEQVGSYLREEFDMADQDPSVKVNALRSYVDGLDSDNQGQGISSAYQKVLSRAPAELDIIEEMRNNINILDDLTRRMQFLLRELQTIIR